MITDAQKKALEAPLDPKHVKKPSGSFGPKGDYLEGWHVINELNRIFGFDGWSYTIDLSRDALTEGQDSKGQPQWQAAYTCICTLTIDGVTRQDVGFGSGFSKGIGDAIEGATKEAATDALKRAARTFGNVFGLALYDKSRANVSAPPEPVIEMIADTDRDEIQAMIEGYGFNILKVCQYYNIASLAEIPAAEVANVKTYLNNAFDKKKQKEAA